MKSIHSKPFLEITVSSNRTELLYIAQDLVTKAMQPHFPNIVEQVRDEFGDETPLDFSMLVKEPKQYGSVYDMVKEHSPKLFDTQVVVSMDIAGDYASRPTHEKAITQLEEMVTLIGTMALANESFSEEPVVPTGKPKGSGLKIHRF